MVDYVVAGAASIENVVTFLDVVKQSRIAVMLIENEAMWSQIPISHQEWVLRSNEIPDIKAPLIPLNEYWVTQAINAGVTNISPHALRASRSKYYLSAHLKQCGVETLSRSYLDNIDEPGPVRYLARLDAGYSGYGIIRDIEAGVFNAETIKHAVQLEASSTMLSVLGDNSKKVVVEDRLEGEEYSVDVFMNCGQIMILRLFRKIIIWVNGKPVCDSYIVVKGSEMLHQAIRACCMALFSQNCISFAQFDFIVADNRAIAVDFSCRIGGGLNAIKEFAGISSYTALALIGHQPQFPPFTVQKNIVIPNPGLLTYVDFSSVMDCKITMQKQVGDQLAESIGSANARIAEICFTALNVEDAFARAAQLDEKVVINVQS